MLKSYLSKLFLAVGLLFASNYAFAQFNTVTINGVDYYGKAAAFGPAWTAVSGEVVLALDGAGASVGCETIVTDVSGKIAMIDRGVCGFSVKALNADTLGAIAVIICNNNLASPYSSIVMGGADPVSVPSMMLSYNDCQLIKSGLPGVMAAITDGVPAALPSERCDNPLVVTPGTYTIDSITTGLGAIFAGAGNAAWYAYTPTSTVTATVDACGGVDSRVYVGLDCGTGLIVAAGDDECEDALGDTVSTAVSFLAIAGTTYYIHFDDRWTDDGFDWTLSEGAAPMTSVTFQVDMKNETVAGDGVFVNVNGTEYAMEDMDADGIYTYEGSFTAGDVLNYLFANGAGNTEDDAAIAACRSVQPLLTAVFTPLVCYNSCAVCPPDVACPNWIDVDFESYTLGTLGNQDPNDPFTTWTFMPGAADDVEVSNEQAFSGTQAMKVTNATGDDALMLLGDRTTGHYILKWKQYVGTGASAYFNIQKFQDTPGATGGFGAEIYFDANSMGRLIAGGGTATAFPYPQADWYEIFLDFDLDNNLTRFWVDGALVREWPTNWQGGAQTGVTQIGAIDFYGAATTDVYYVDDVLFKQIEACPANALICDGFDAYDLGSTGPQSPWWTTWTFMPGGADDGLVTNNQFLSCEQAMEISNAGGDDVLLLLGDRTTGNYLLRWDLYVPTGSSAYFNTQKFQNTPGVTGGFGLEAYFDAPGTGRLLVGSATPIAFDYPQGVWFEVAMYIDLDNNLMNLVVDGVVVNTWPANWQSGAQTGTKQIGAIDFYGAAAGEINWVDNVLFQQLPSVPGNICGGAIDLAPYFGQGVGTVTNTPLYDNTGYTTEDSDPATGYECFGEPDGGGATPSLENTVWYTFVGDGETYVISTDECSATNYIDDGDTQIAIYSGADCANLTPVLCNEDAVLGGPPYPAGDTLQTVAGTTYFMMIDGFLGVDGEYCIAIEQLTGTIPTVDVTFRVDMTNEITDPAGVFIAGSFNGWSNEAMTAGANNVWTITKEIPEDEAIQWKFKNGPEGWENNNTELINCGVDDGGGSVNRALTTADANITTPIYCFNYCITCAEVSTTDTEFSRAIGISPNPASNQVNVSYNFPEMTDLNIRMVNSLGQLVTERFVSSALSGVEKMDIAKLPSGTYMVVFSNGEHTVAKRLVVN